jgi:hypothetical protein
MSVNMNSSVFPIRSVVEGRRHRSTGHKLLLATGFSGVLFISVFVILDALAPGYSGLHETISALEFTTLSVGQRANFFIFGVLLCCFAVGLRKELVPDRGAFLIPLFQVLSGLGVIGDAIFIYEPLHLLFDLMAFNSALLVLFFFAWRFTKEPTWSGWATYSIVSAFAMIAFLAAFGFANHFGGPAGLLEKLATCTRTLWSALFTARLLAGRCLGHI